MHGNPPALLFSVVPVFVYFVEDLASDDFENVANLILVIVQGVVVRQSGLRHF